MKSRTKPRMLMFSLFLGIMFVFCGNPALADESSLFEREKLTGDWGGARTSLEEKGITVDLLYTTDTFISGGGGVDRPSSTIYLDKWKLTAGLETGKAGLWDGGKFFFQGLSTHGMRPSDYVGDLQVTSNIETYEATRLFELWYEHSFMGDKVAVLGGLHDLNTEFYISDGAALFLNSSFGIGPDIASNETVSIFPVSAPALRVKAKPADNWTVLAAIYNGDPGADKNINGLDITIDDKTRGFMNIGEVQYMLGGEDAKLPGTYRVGVWYHSKTHDDVKAVDENGEPVKHSGDQGIYLSFDQRVYSAGEKAGISIFARGGLAPKDKNTISQHLGAGVTSNGMIPGRADDSVGFAVSDAKISDDLVDATKDAGGPSLTRETAWELTYRAKIFGWLYFQPDYQMVVNPGGDSDIDTAHVVTGRFDVSF